LQLKYDELLSNIAFKFNLRRYTMGHGALADTLAAALPAPAKVGRCRLTLSNPP
jgi:hypothetical protein